MRIKRLNAFRCNIILYRNYCNRLNAERLTGFPNTYNTKEREKYWNDIWEQNNYFNPDKNASSSIRMILPPPNVTGILHLGHALTVTIQDMLARWHRMKGDSVLWVPGLDHAGIATQVVVEKYLASTKNVTRFDLGKEKFLEYVEDWKNEKSDAIRNQLRHLAATLNWSNEYFTMSKEHSNSVIEAFITLNKRDLLYRNNDLVNWSPFLRSTISDIEVEYLAIPKRTEIQVPGYSEKIPFGEMSDIEFQLKDLSDVILVSTTRVESMLGDVAIAVHPEDSRYTSFIGQQTWHPLRQVLIPIIADSSVLRDFGTGAVKITPGHSHQDLEIARKHNLEVIQVIGEDGKMNENAIDFKGLPRFTARTKILDKLQNGGYLKDTKDHMMLVPVCSRSGDVIEYLMKEQWFVRTKKMAERVAEAVRNGELKFDSSRYEELWFDKLDNIRDWCVSRQLWWGHQIPAYSCEINSQMHWIIARNAEEARKISEKQFGNAAVKQDSDVLDTWFSAALLPLSAMGWPHQKYQQYYPLSLMETGHDILFYWVGKMAMLCTELEGVLPFKEVLLHGILCDAQGRKMSKSRGNVILPEFVINGISLDDLNAKANENFDRGILNKAELKRTLTVNAKSFPKGISECGSDALRFTLCSHNIKNEKVSFNVDECITNKHFCNKIWQASKYVLLVTDEKPLEMPQTFSIIDRWILSRLAWMVDTVNTAFEQRNFHKAISAIRQFFYYEFCDYFIESTKPGLESDDKDIKNSHKYCLVKCLEVFLRTIMPVMPYLSEELYSRLAERLPNFLKVPSVMSTSFPSVDEIGERNCESEEQFSKVIKVVLTLRNILSHVNKKCIAEVHIVPDHDNNYDFYNKNRIFFLAMTRLNDIKVYHANDYTMKHESICCSEAECQLYYLLTDNEMTMQVRKKVRNKRLKMEEKLQDLLTIITKPKYNGNASDLHKIKMEESIKSLQSELEKYPKFV